MPPTDMLAEIFDCQKALNQRIGVDTDAMDEEQQVKWLLNYSRALSQETAEMIDSVPWKWWAKYQKYDRANVQVEIVDMLHFLVSLAQVAGLSAKDVHELYMKKNRVNFQRQETGYAVKDESDNAPVKLGK
ncbi:MAG: dUTP diphosphatase [Deltaproteobacteria bacterium]|nr:dUTP diphosphatase [Deltaproteobacteria bacterium]